MTNKRHNVIIRLYDNGRRVGEESFFADSYMKGDKLIVGEGQKFTSDVRAKIRVDKITVALANFPHFERVLDDRENNLPVVAYPYDTLAVTSESGGLMVINGATDLWQ